MRPMLLGLGALAVIAGPLAAQQCIAPHPSGHVATLDYGVAPIDARTLAEAGFTYGRRLSAAQWVGTGNSLLVEGSWHNGRVTTAGAGGDHTARRASAGATAITALSKRISVCGYAGAGWYTGDGAAPVRHLDVPAGVGIGLTLPVGGLVLLPYVMPTAAYFARSVRTTDSTGATVTRDSGGRDLALTVGGAVRFGRTDLRASWRLKDARVEAATLFRIQVGVWF